MHLYHFRSAHSLINDIKAKQTNKYKYDCTLTSALMCVSLRLWSISLFYFLHKYALVCISHTFVWPSGSTHLLRISSEHWVYGFNPLEQVGRHHVGGPAMWQNSVWHWDELRQQCDARLAENEVVWGHSALCTGPKKHSCLLIFDINGLLASVWLLVKVIQTTTGKW